MHSPAILFLFQWRHLGRGEQIIARPFEVLAQTMANCLPENEEQDEALKALLDARNLALASFIKPREVLELQKNG